MCANINFFLELCGPLVMILSIVIPDIDQLMCSRRHAWLDNSQHEHTNWFGYGGIYNLRVKTDYFSNTFDHFGFTIYNLE